MSIFSKVESGTSFNRSRFTRSISNTMRYDCRFYELIPVLKRFVLPGDIWRISGDVLVRFHPMLSPTLTPNSFRVRYFFVPLRLVEENTELIITGSKDGKLYSDTLPVFKNFTADCDKLINPDAYKVTKWSFWDYMGVQTADYEPIKSNSCLPAQYWHKAYTRIWWDYYRDENLFNGDDFETIYATIAPVCPHDSPAISRLPKDYFTSSLPWQLKGVAPRIDVTGAATFTPAYTGNFFSIPDTDGSGGAIGADVTASFNSNVDPVTKKIGTANSTINTNLNSKLLDFLNVEQTAQVTQLGFTADDLRTMMAQTRIFERLARTGSRYTEYLRGNFGIAPADDTLQRAQYLGGWKVPIVTTEVLQTAADGSTPVGTMRGHGITRGGNRISTFYAKEFGVLFGLAEIRPNIEYTTGIPRELSYKSRFDFFNPSLQHLSEQEVRNGELFISESDGKNDDTFGFQAYGNELRSSHDETVGDLRDSLKYWVQSLSFTSRPNLNDAFIKGSSHFASFNRPFAVSDVTARPCIVQFANNLDVYRPMVRYATPGLVDHL